MRNTSEVSFETSSFEYVLQEENSLLCDSGVASLSRGGNGTVWAFQENFCYHSSEGILKKEIGFVSQEERDLQFDIKVRISIQGKSS